MNQKAKYDLYIQNKLLARDQKSADIALVNSHPDDYRICAFDLQAIIQLPSGQVSAFYYKRRLNAYNFTLYDIVRKEGFCCVWTESTGGKGAIETATSIYDFICSECSMAEHVIFYSDNCSAQNKNQFLLYMYIYILINSIQQNLKLKSITHNYLIKGHTQNEGDSMHSTIEKQMNKIVKMNPIYTPGQFVGIVQSAKKTGKPYKVREIHFSEFLDFKSLKNSIVLEKTIPWTKLTRLRVSLNSDLTSVLIEYKTTWEAGEFTKVGHSLTQRRHTSTRVQALNQSSSLGNDFLSPLQSAYKKGKGISAAKKADLLSLFSVIPAVHHEFFSSLPVSKKANDEEDSADEEEDTI